MGLDVSFSRDAAVAAGIIIQVIPREGTYDEGDEPEYIAWCNGSDECIKVPGMEHFVVNDAGSDTHIFVRANKWGSTYAPLTEWLTTHAIEWQEG